MIGTRTGGARSRNLWSRGFALLLLLPIAASAVHLILPHASTSTHCALCRLSQVPTPPAVARILVEGMIPSFIRLHRPGPEFFV